MREAPQPSAKWAERLALCGGVGLYLLGHVAFKLRLTSKIGYEKLVVAGALAILYAAGGGLALLQTGDRVRIDLKKRSANILISDRELNERRAALAANGGYDYPKSQTPWQQIQREMVAQFDEGMVLKPAVHYQRLAQTMGVPRDNH